MTFSEAIAAQPQWIGWWVNWMMAVFAVSAIVFLFSAATRLAALLTLLAFIAGAVLLNLMYQQMGYVRLLGLPHLIFWTPLAVYLRARLRSRDVTGVFRIVMYVLLATILVSLIFDSVDVARYLLGERKPAILPPP